MISGVVIGKFLPLHRGHRHLIEVALRGCDELWILIVGRSDEEAFAPLAVRAAWLRELFPGPQVHIVDRLSDAPTSATDQAIVDYWNQLILEMTGLDQVDRLFTSERGTYEEVTAAGIGARHVGVDPDRSVVPISGTSLRQDVYGGWAYLDAPVRAFFARRVRLLGGESTGKSTLSDLLARRFATAWVPEWGRPYADPKDHAGEPWTTADFSAIATRQNELEDIAAGRSDRLLVCDTDALTTGIWHVEYLGRRDAGVESLGADRPYDLSLILEPDIAWRQDGMRDSDQARHRQQAALIERLTELGQTALPIRGDLDERLATAQRAVVDGLGLQPRPTEVDWVELGRAGRWRGLDPAPGIGTRVVRGTEMSAAAAQARLVEERLTYEELAAASGVSIEAIREADWYASRHAELAYAELRGDTAAMTRLQSRPAL
jgi:HTH-type transcriptional regulator, transcriptional repressor of NAD biosynthesis genes